MTNSHVLTCIVKKERKSLGGSERVPEAVQPCKAFLFVIRCVEYPCQGEVVQVRTCAFRRHLLYPVQQSAKRNRFMPSPTYRPRF